MYWIVNFKKHAKSRFPRTIRKEKWISKYIVLLQSPMLFLFWRDHCWSNCGKRFREYIWRHIIKAEKLRYDDKVTLKILSVIM
jgi:hypothetical protein